MTAREKYVWGDGDVEVTPAPDPEELAVEAILERDHFDPGEDTYGDWYSGPDR